MIRRVNLWIDESDFLGQIFTLLRFFWIFDYVENLFFSF